jgi:Fic family protein
MNETAGEKVKVIPGEYRTHDVQVGRHISINFAVIPLFMARFEGAYAKLGRTNMILASAAAHHRLSWIHPFADGNGRVMHLMSYAILRDVLDTGGIWSIARGLARQADECKQHLAMCDLPRRNDLDGRGILSQEALFEFTKFFLQVCIEQVKFMEELVQPKRLHHRIKYWAEEVVSIGKLTLKGINVLEAILYRGALSRSHIQEVLGTRSRHARRIVSDLIDLGVIKAETMRSPFQLAFPARLASRWMPGLFPEKY